MYDDAIYPELPFGYRWANAEETERFTHTGKLDGMIQVRVGGDDNDPWTDLAVMTLEQCSANVGGDPASGCDDWAVEGSAYCTRHNREF
jgi:hypothetical protein